MKAYIFGEFRVSVRERRLYRLPKTEIPLTPRVFDLLVKLLQSAGTVVTKDELLSSVWPDTIVEESNLSQSIFILRKALGESSQHARLIRTVPTKGYKFSGEVVETDDTAAQLEVLTNEPGGSEEKRSDAKASAPSRWRRLLVGALLVSAAIGTIGYIRSSKAAVSDAVIYQQLTFERGTVWSARFLPGANAVVYNANFNNRGLDLFTLHLLTPESRSMGPNGANLLAISSKGEIALLHDQRYIYQFVQRGTLARMPIDGSALRDVAENVQEADWSPSGDDLAIVRWTDGGDRLEYPIGTVLASTPGYYSYPRVSRTGDRIALFEHEFQRDNRGTVVIIGTDGHRIVSSQELGGLEGLAWHGNEVWFTASKSGESYALYAMDLNGNTRAVVSAPTNLILDDVDPDGSVLLSRATQQTDVYLNETDRPDQDLSWLQLIGIADLAVDGKSFLFTHFGAGSGKNYSVYLRKTDGSAAVNLGEGRALALSVDSRYALVKMSDPEGLVVLPTGPGERRTLSTGDLEQFGPAAWTPDGQRIIFIANEKGHGRRTFSLDPNAGGPTPVTPEGVFGTLMSPDGANLLVDTSTGKALFNIKTGQLQAIGALDPGEEVVRWGSDGNSLYIYRPLDLPIKIFKLRIKDGSRELVREIKPTNTSGTFGNIYLVMTPDAKSVVYGLRRYLVDLYLVKGLR